MRNIILTLFLILGSFNAALAEDISVQLFNGMFLSDNSITVSDEASEFIWQQALEDGTKVSKTKGLNHLSFKGWFCILYTKDAKFTHKVLFRFARIIGIMDGRIICNKPIFN